MLPLCERTYFLASLLLHSFVFSEFTQTCTSSLLFSLPCFITCGTNNPNNRQTESLHLFWGQRWEWKWGLCTECMCTCDPKCLEDWKHLLQQWLEPARSYLSLNGAAVYLNSLRENLIYSIFLCWLNVSASYTFWVFWFSFQTYTSSNFLVSLNQAS